MTKIISKKNEKTKYYLDLFTPVILPLKIESPTFKTKFSFIVEVCCAVRI
jgi:hypothetical protein